MLSRSLPILLHLVGFLELVCSNPIRRGPPKISTVISGPINHLIGSQIRLRCPVNANAKSTFVEWSRNNMPLEHISRYFVTLNGLLRIDFAQPEDSGVYTCRVINGFGSVNATVTLNVFGSEGDLIYLLDPMTSHDHINKFLQRDSEFPIKVQPKVLKKAIGKFLKLRCKTKEKSSVKWLKDGQQIMTSGNPRFLINDHTLVIQSLRWEDFGQYQCESANGEIIEWYNLTRKEKFSRPIVQIDPSNMTIISTQNAIFECRFTRWTLQRPTVQWFKKVENFSNRHLDGSLVEFDGVTYRPLGSPTLVAYPEGDFNYYNTSLTILNAKQEDSGTYLCSLKWSNGHLSHKNATLEVIPLSYQVLMSAWPSITTPSTFDHFTPEFTYHFSNQSEISKSSRYHLIVYAAIVVGISLLFVTSIVYILVRRSYDSNDHKNPISLNSIPTHRHLSISAKTRKVRIVGHRSNVITM